MIMQKGDTLMQQTILLVLSEGKKRERKTREEESLLELEQTMKSNP